MFFFLMIRSAFNSFSIDRRIEEKLTRIDGVLRSIFPLICRIIEKIKFRMQKKLSYSIKLKTNFENNK